MNSKNFIRLNTSDNYLSLGNLFRIIKEEAHNTHVFWQSELFSIIFNTDDIGDSTINNYCTGYRAINPKYKNYLKSIKENFVRNKDILIIPIAKILQLAENSNINIDYISISDINSNLTMKNICTRLYSISKNDSEVDINMSNNLHLLLENNDLYTFFITILFYVVLDKKQPIYIEKELTSAIEKSIYDTNISLNDIEAFINIHLNSGIWSIRGIMQLAKKNNPFACFEMASMEFYGIISGKPRYDIAYKYYKIAAQNNHPVATWAIGFLYYKGYIGNLSKYDLYLAFKYFNRARKLKCSNAFNSIGLILLNGNIPHINKSEQKAIKMFETAISMGNIYAYNNLGKIYENSRDYKKAFSYYLVAANLGESWAANKVGDFYRCSIGVTKDLEKAFNYYTIASECSNFTLCKWSRFNLAKYFYEYGVLELDIEKNLNKAIELLDSICDDFLPALKELIYIYFNLYLNNKNNSEYLNKVHYYKLKCELCDNYNNEIKYEIEKTLNEIDLSVSPINLP